MKLSKHNYSQHYNKPKKQNNPVKTSIEKPAVTEEMVKPNVVQSKPTLIQETIETKPLPKTVGGMVVGCAKLNVRAKPSLFADVVCTLDAMSEMEIDVNKSNNDWFYIYTAIGAEGYCMRKFVEAHL